MEFSIGCASVYYIVYEIEYVVQLRNIFQKKVKPKTAI